VEVVERVVHVPVERTHTPRHREWPELLRELAALLDSGRIYQRDLPHLGAALSLALAAYERHPTASTRARTLPPSSLPQPSSNLRHASGVYPMADLLTTIRLSFAALP
jgi:hypothetical protein